MSKIKTREKTKDIKVPDRSAIIGQRMKSAFIRSKKNAEALMDDRQATPKNMPQTGQGLPRMIWPTMRQMWLRPARKRRCDRGGSCCSASGRNGRQKSARRIRPQLNSPTPLDRPRGVPRIGTPRSEAEGQSQSASAFHSISA